MHRRNGTGPLRSSTCTASPDTCSGSGRGHRILQDGRRRRRVRSTLPEGDLHRLLLYPAVGCALLRSCHPPGSPASTDRWMRNQPVSGRDGRCQDRSRPVASQYDRIGRTRPAQTLGATHCRRQRLLLRRGGGDLRHHRAQRCREDHHRRVHLRLFTIQGVVAA